MANFPIGLYSFNPRQLSGLCLWLDGNDPAGNGVLPTNGASIATWFDKSLNSNSGTQSTGAIQPTFTRSAVNNNGGIAFSGTQFLTLATHNNFPSGSAGRSHFIAFRTNASPTGSLSGYGAFSSTEAVTIYGAGTFTVDLNAVVITANSISASTNYIFEWDYTTGSAANTSTIKVNNISQTVSGAANVLNTVITFNNIGSSLSGGSPTNNTILEVIYYNNRLSAVNALKVYQYLHAKWGI